MKGVLVYLWNKFVDIIIFTLKKLTILKDNILSLFVKKPQILSIEETINEIVKNKSSVSRYGDGEFKLARGIDISFQKANDNLQRRLVEILRINERNFIVCIPDVFGKLNIYKKDPKEYWKIHMGKYRLKWNILLDMSKVYGNAFISRFYYQFEDKSKCKQRFNLVKKIWERREIVLIEGAKSRLGIGNDLFDNAASIERILVPEINAFEKYNEIINRVKAVNKEKLILLAAGPSATVLAYDLHRLGFQAIDIGHVDIEYEWFLRKSDKKIAIDNKFVCEAGFGEGVGELRSKIYESQIKAVI